MLSVVLIISVHAVDKLLVFGFRQGQCEEGGDEGHAAKSDHGDGEAKAGSLQRQGRDNC